MAYEVRRIPPGWQHPVVPGPDYAPRWTPLYSPDEWEAMLADREAEPEAYAGRPSPDPLTGRMPDEPGPGQPRQYVLYETVTYGTPVSPPFATMAELNEWRQAWVASQDCGCPGHPAPGRRRRWDRKRAR